MVDSRVRFKILAEGNFNMGVQQHKVNSSLEYVKGARFSKNSKLVPLASMTLIHPVLRKIIYQRGTKCSTCRKAISICKTAEKNYTRLTNFVNSEGVSDTIHKSPSSGEASKRNKNVKTTISASGPEISELLEKGAIQKAETAQEGFLSNLYLAGTVTQ